MSIFDVAERDGVAVERVGGSDGVAGAVHAGAAAGGRAGAAAGPAVGRARRATRAGGGPRRALYRAPLSGGYTRTHVLNVLYVQ